MAMELRQLEKCTGCGNCVISCPCDVFRLDATVRKTTIAYPEDCQVCSMCTIYCPTGVIAVTPDKITKPITAYL